MSGLQPHEGSSETGNTNADSDRVADSFNPTRVRLKPPVVLLDSNGTVLQPHEGSSETMTFALAMRLPMMLQPHEGSSETLEGKVFVDRAYKASTPRGFV